MGKFSKALQAFATALDSLALLEQYLQAARDNHEMTPEEEENHDAHVARRLAMPHWHGRNPPDEGRTPGVI